MAAFHGKLREGRLSPEQYANLRADFRRGIEAGAFLWIEFSPAVREKVEEVYGFLAPSVFLRAADAAHLACAAVFGFPEIYSNDRRQLAAAPNFGLVGVNVI